VLHCNRVYFVRVPCKVKVILNRYGTKQNLLAVQTLKTKLKSTEVFGGETCVDGRDVLILCTLCKGCIVFTWFQKYMGDLLYFMKQSGFVMYLS
jgi:hypothetical protein